MALLGIDLGGTKLALALFTGDGKIISKNRINHEDRKGNEVGELICSRIGALISLQEKHGDKIKAIGICVPGIFNSLKGTVWAPNIPGWEDYPLLDEVRKTTLKIPVTIDSDRSCSLLGEVWQGNAKDCRNAIFIAVGTGIGAGIMCNSEVIQGSHDIAGAIGWMTLDRSFRDEYMECGFLESHTSGEGIGKMARRYLSEDKSYNGELKLLDINDITSYEVFKAWGRKDPVAVRVIDECVEYWGMAVANLVSLFNPEKIIFGGGIFGPAVPLITRIRTEATRWAQPVSMRQVSLEASALGGDAGVFGAAYLALLSI